MAFKMSPMGKNKCSYSPMQKKGLISPVTKTPPYYGGGEDTKVTVTKTPTATGFNEETKEIITKTPFANKPKVNMKTAYANRDMKVYGNLSFPEYEKEAISQSKPRVTTNISNRVVENKKEELADSIPEIDYSYLDGLAQTGGYKAGDGQFYGTKINSTVGKTLRGSEDPAEREMTQAEANYLNEKSGKKIYGGPMSTFEDKKLSTKDFNKYQQLKESMKVNSVIEASF